MSRTMNFCVPSVSKSNFHAYNKLRSEVLLAEVWLTSVAMCRVEPGDWCGGRAREPICILTREQAGVLHVD